MSVKKEPSGRRSVQTEFEVPGTPEEVWQAIATGPGVSSWMMPAEFEERDGKPVAMRLKFRPGIEPRSTVTTWDPPRALSLLGSGPAPGSPPIASEWHIEARAGGTCTLRLVHSLFSSTDDWDDQLEGVESGWSGFLRTLRVYLAHFRGQRSTLMKWMVPVAGAEAEAWQAFTTAVGLEGLGVGRRWTAPAGVPEMSGAVEYVSTNPNDVLVRIDTPGPAIAAFGSVEMGGPCRVGMNVYFYGEQADANAAREAPRWEAWTHANLPAPSKPADCD
jgi:uncharacterized protein YndB with AHSA1/START domain